MSGQQRRRAPAAPAGAGRRADCSQRAGAGWRVGRPHGAEACQPRTLTGTANGARSVAKFMGRLKKGSLSTTMGSARSADWYGGDGGGAAAQHRSGAGAGVGAGPAALQRPTLNITAPPAPRQAPAAHTHRGALAARGAVAGTAGAPVVGRGAEPAAGAWHHTSRQCPASSLRPRTGHPACSRRHSSRRTRTCPRMSRARRCSGQGVRGTVRPHGQGSTRATTRHWAAIPDAHGQSPVATASVGTTKQQPCACARAPRIAAGQRRASMRCLFGRLSRGAARHTLKGQSGSSRRYSCICGCRRMPCTRKGKPADVWPRPGAKLGATQLGAIQPAHTRDTHHMEE